MNGYLRKWATGTLLLCTVVAMSMLYSCSDDYAYDDKEPNFLGGSIYEYLQNEGEFNTYLRLMDHLSCRRQSIRAFL